MAKGYVLDLISDTAQTTDGSTITLLALPAIASGQMMGITYTSVAKSGNNMRACTRTAVFRNIAGTLTLLGSVVDILPAQGDAALSLAGCTLAVVGNAPCIRVTGLALTTIDWYAGYNYQVFY